MKRNARHTVCAVLLALCLLLTAAPLSGFSALFLPISAQAAEITDSGSCGDNVTYTLDSDGLLTISGIGEMTDYESYSGSPFEHDTRIKTVVIKDGVTSIGNYAFDGCKGLTGITIPNSVTSIGSHAFFYCEGLTSVTIPNSVTSIGSHAFSDCTGLTSVTIPDSVTSIGDRAFLLCTGLTSVTISNGVISIGEAAFADCSGLTSVTIPKSVTSIGEWAFSGCKGLASITVAAGNPKYHSENNCLIETNTKTLVFGCKKSVIPADGSVTSIGDSAFYYCAGLTFVTIPDSVTSIGSLAFLWCADLTSVTIPKSVTSIGDRAFEGCTGLTSVTIPDSVTIIAGNAFYRCRGLTSVTIPDSVTRIGSGAFWGCTGLTSITIPNSVTTIRNAAFGGCSGLTSVTIPDSLTNIESYTFWDCTGLTSVSIPKSVTSIGDGAFSECTALQRVNYEGSESDWAQIDISEDNDSLQNAEIIYNYTPDVGYTVTYNANGGTGAPEAQTKEADVALTLSSVKPIKNYTLSFNANGGSVSPASRTLSCTFENWNTLQNGSGTSYISGGDYTANTNATLYAQWTNPTAGDLPTPTRGGDTFTGWYTSDGTLITSSSVITSNMTLYAQWNAKNIYNLGEETYSFANFADSIHPSGNCFGMSVTSAGYYLKLLDIAQIGGTASTPLYSFSLTAAVSRQICKYQGIQGSSRDQATVAGGSRYLKDYNDINADWDSVLNYVKDHSYDNTGKLQIGFRKDGEGGHAINFLRYENVNGQDRIYAYDSNFPDVETYFYKDASGNVLQAQRQTFSGALDCIALRDIQRYYTLSASFDATRAFYMDKNAAIVLDCAYTYMEGETGGGEYVMYEIPADQTSVTIVPLVDNATFIYMDQEYTFGEVDENTRAEFELATVDESGAQTPARFTVYEAGTETALPGDLNGDGKVTAADARLALRRAVGLETYEAGSVKFLACDVNHDGKITAADARLILRAAVGLEKLK